MNAREEVLARVRAALGDVSPVERPADVAVPRTYRQPHAGADLAALFTERVEDYRATVTLCTEAEVAATIESVLGAARRIVVPPGLDRSWLPPGLEVSTDDPPLTATRLDAVDAVVTAASVGIAETGTIVLDHGDDQGRRVLTLVPDVHVCVVRAAQLVDDVPAAVRRVGSAVRAGRPLTWISGPSATSDIELSRVEGVHGPRSLHVVLVTAPHAPDDV